MRIHDKEFELFISAEQIAGAILHIAVQLNARFSNSNPLFVIVLKGAYLFGADLTRQFQGACEISFTKIKSYHGTERAEISEFSGFQTDVTNRHVIIIEDIVDSGATLQKLVQELSRLNASSITTVALLQKYLPSGQLIKADIVGLEIPDVFVVGYGLDYNEEGRNLADIWRLKE